MFHVNHLSEDSHKLSSLIFSSKMMKDVVAAVVITVLNSLHAGQFFILFCRLLTFFKINVSKNSFDNTIRVSNSLDPV